MEIPTWLQTILDRLVGDAIFFGILFLIFIAVRVIVRFSINRYFKALYFKAKSKSKQVKKDRFNTLANAVNKVVKVILWSLVILAVMLHYNVNVAFLLSGAGALGIFLGIAGKDILMDLYSGAMVLIEGQYDLGDWVEIDENHSGTVEDITLRTVVLRDLDGNIHVVPHSQATSIINMTPDYSGIRVEVGVSYSSDLNKVKKVINDVGQKLAKDKDWKEDFIQPIYFDRTLSFDDSAIAVRALGKVQPGRQWAVTGEFNNRLKSAFDENGIEIPFPQRTVHLPNK